MAQYRRLSLMERKELICGRPCGTPLSETIRFARDLDLNGSMSFSIPSWKIQSFEGLCRT